MTDKQQIEEMRKFISQLCCNSNCDNCEWRSVEEGSCLDYFEAEALYNAGYRKVEQDYAELLHEYERLADSHIKTMQLVREVCTKRDVLKKQLAEARKETAKEIFTKLIEVAKNNDNKISIGLLKAWAIEYDVEVEE